MDQAQFILMQMQGVGFTVTNIQFISGAVGLAVSSLVMWGLMTKNINKRIEGKVDKDVYAVQIDSMKTDITEIKDTAKEDRALFLGEMKLLREDLRLKKDKP